MNKCFVSFNVSNMLFVNFKKKERKKKTELTMQRDVVTMSFFFRNIHFPKEKTKQSAPVFARGVIPAPFYQTDVKSSSK